MNTLNITILGVGAIGSLWACQLAKAGHRVTLWQRSSEQSLISLQLDDEPAIEFVTNSNAALIESDLLLVTVKAWQVESALSPLLPNLTPETVILFMHNGMGSIDSLASKLRRHPLVVATTTHGAYRHSTYAVSHTGEGKTLLGGVNANGKKCSFLTEVLDHALPQATWSGNIQTALWNKLAINCVINPLTALHQCRNGELVRDKFKPLITTLLDEIYQVMQAEQIPLSRETLQESVMGVIEATAINYSSMKQDIAHQRKSEIDFISGYLCRKAEQHKIAVNENYALYRKIKQIESSWSKA